MVLYQVELSVQSQVYSQFVNWLKNEHIKEVLETPGFLYADLCLGKMGVAIESSSQQIKVLYYVNDDFSLKSYLSDRAMKLREKGIEKFPGQFSAGREMWSELTRFQITH